MEKPFEIKFDFPIAHSEISIPLTAIAELHHSDPYYVVHSFRYDDTHPHHHSQLSVLPNQEVKLIKKGRQKVWVHRGSEKESLLSMALGKAIESR